MKDISFIKNLDSYELCSSEELTDTGSLGAVLKHKKTGARIALISNEDNNKVFYIGFRTTPTDSTGVPHIIEHSVLCGSDKYPVKDPFVELAKSSLNTFLNAVTFADKTVYPVASCNDQDIKNLMDVYMDAVLHPNIYHHEEIFKQEGWHYELESPEAELKINGVVYNEMKGAFSNADEVVDEDIMHALFPDNTYSVCSGGDPDVIPSLTYENFLDFHRRYYHPSNSYIYLYGDFDMEERLRWLDEEYLSKYDYLFVNSEIRPQKFFDKPVTVYKKYPVSAEEDTKEKTYLYYNLLVDVDKSDIKTNLAMGIINVILLVVSGAPIRQALTDAGIGKNIMSDYNTSLLQPGLEILATFAEKDRLDDFVRIIEDGFREQAEKGLNADSLLAAINSMEFRYREGDTGSTPKGLVDGISILDTWLYNDTQVFDNLRRLKLFEELRQEIGSGYFEKLIKEKILGNTHKVILVSEPDPGMTERKEKALAQKLAEYKASLSAEEIQKIADDTKALRAYQEAEDTPEALATLPVLKVSDVEKKAMPGINEERDVDGTTIVFHDINTYGIIYAGMYFKLPRLTKDYSHYVSLFVDMLQDLNTDKHTYLEMNNETGIHLGGLGFSLATYHTSKRDGSFNSYITAKFKCLAGKCGKAFELAEEVLHHSCFDDKKRLKEVLGEFYTSKLSSLIGRGHTTAVDRAVSYFSERAAFEQSTNGIEYYEFLKDLYEHFDERADEVIDRFSYFAKNIVEPGNILVSLTCRENEYQEFADGLKEFKAKLDLGNKPEIRSESINTKPFVPEIKNEAFRIAGGVQFCATAGNFIKAGVKYNGALAVLKTMMGYDYLWMNVRVKGGAYGCFFSCDKIGGNCFIVSYRDPNLKNTYEIFKGAAEYIKNIKITQEEVNRYIIGTMSSIDLPKTPSAKGAHSFLRWMSGTTQEEAQKDRDEILGATPEVIRSLSDVLAAAVESGCICTIGSAGKIAEDAELFKEIKDLN